MFQNVAYYFPLVLTIILVVLTWIFGDWRNWKKYYPTILFGISVDFFIGLILYEHSLWQFHESLFVPNHSIADFLIAFTNLPAIVLLFLSRYPSKSRLLSKAIYTSFWIILFTLIETLFYYLNLLTYHNGWNFIWSVIVWIIMFIGLLIHYKNPIIAWLLCFVCTIYLIYYFQIPVLNMK